MISSSSLVAHDEFGLSALTALPPLVVGAGQLRQVRVQLVHDVDEPLPARKE